MSAIKTTSNNFGSLKTPKTMSKDYPLSQNVIKTVLKKDGLSQDNFFSGTKPGKGGCIKTKGGL